jgi:hypothetical protein
MKTQVKIYGLLLMMNAIGLTSQGCSENLNGSSPEFADILSVGGDGTTSVLLNNLEAIVSDQLTFEDKELQTLLHMKEEEKLARDVYTVFYGKWKIPVFSNISKAETTHLNAVIFLLKDYGEDYTKVKEPGVFEDPKFQELYDQLVSKASVSVGESYKAGALIEEMDIKDLTEQLNVVSNENIKLVFENLRKGSRNHLRAFNRRLAFLGQTYEPQYISKEEFSLIINSPHETGNRYKMRTCGF